MEDKSPSEDYTLSDRTTKDNITLIPDALDKVKALTGNTFTWNTKPSPDSKRLGKPDIGVIAQEVEALGLCDSLIFDREDGTKQRCPHKEVMFPANNEISICRSSLSSQSSARIIISFFFMNWSLSKTISGPYNPRVTCSHALL